MLRQFKRLLLSCNHHWKSLSHPASSLYIAYLSKSCEITLMGLPTFNMEAKLYHEIGVEESFASSLILVHCLPSKSCENTWMGLPTFNMEAKLYHEMGVVHTSKCKRSMWYPLSNTKLLLLLWMWLITLSLLMLWVIYQLKKFGPAFWRSSWPASFARATMSSYSNEPSREVSSTASSHQVLQFLQQISKA